MSQVAPDDGIGLIATLIQANYDAYADITQSLLDSLQAENEKLRTERDHYKRAADLFYDAKNYETLALKAYLGVEDWNP